MKSIIDVRKLLFEYFQVLYTPLLKVSDDTDPVSALKKASEIYRALDGGSECVSNYPFHLKMPY